MRLLFDSLFIGLATLFLIRLYTSNERFAQIINRFFSSLELIYHKTRTRYPKGIKGLLLTSLGIALFIGLIAVISELSVFSAITYTFLFLVIGIPLYMEMVDHQQTSEIQRLLEAIRNGKLSQGEMFAIKQALKDFHKSQYAPSLPRESKPTLLTKLIQAVILLMYPKAWPRVIIPRITSIPLFSDLFYTSPHHARFSGFKTMIDSVYDHTRTHPFRLHIKEATVFEEFLVIEFKDTKKHSLKRAKALARKLEKEHQLTKESILVQDHNEHYKFFIPAQTLEGIDYAVPAPQEVL